MHPAPPDQTVVDPEVEGLLRGLDEDAERYHASTQDGAETEAEQEEHLTAIGAGIATLRAAVGEDRMAFGMGRRLQAIEQQRAAIERQKRTLVGQLDAALERLNKQAHFLNDAVNGIVLARRERGDGNTLELPGVGTWASRKVAAVPRIDDEDAVLAALEGDLRAQFVTEVPKLDRRGIVAHVKETGESIDGIGVREASISVTAKYVLEGGTP